MSVPLVLASASTARLALLRRAGIDPEVVVSDVDEDAALADARARYGELEPADAVLVLARAKCEAVAADLDTQCVVLGCDSLLELDGKACGKPGTPEAAAERWRSMRGRTGVLHTGHWLIDLRDEDEGGTGATLGATASTQVTFADASDAEIEAYVATGEPVHVAGAFTIDGRGAALVERLDGDAGNVIGVSPPLLRELLADLGLTWFDLA